LRAKETAEIIQQALGVPLRFDERLVECGFGKLEGVSRTQLAGGSVFGHWAAVGEAEFLRQGAESLYALYERVGDFLDAVGARHAGQTVLVVAHGGVGHMAHWFFHGRDETDPAKYGNAILRTYTAKLAGDRPVFTG